MIVSSRERCPCRRPFDRVQIAQALEEAHDKGIVHRDLKPQNVKASSEGKAKVLDFGSGQGDGRDRRSAVRGRSRALADVMNSPTLTAVHGTQLGVILGTAAYMAPEQARGVAVDKRADIWAFGVRALRNAHWRARCSRARAGRQTSPPVMRQEHRLEALPAGTPVASGSCCAAASSATRRTGCTTSPTRASSLRSSCRGRRSHGARWRRPRAAGRRRASRRPGR